MDWISDGYCGCGWSSGVGFTPCEVGWARRQAASSCRRVPRPSVRAPASSDRPQRCGPARPGEQLLRRRQRCAPTFIEIPAMSSLSHVPPRPASTRAAVPCHTSSCPPIGGRPARVARTSRERAAGSTAARIDRRPSVRLARRRRRARRVRAVTRQPARDAPRGCSKGQRCQQQHARSGGPDRSPRSTPCSARGWRAGAGTAPPSFGPPSPPDVRGDRARLPPRPNDARHATQPVELLPVHEVGLVHQADRIHRAGARAGRRRSPSRSAAPATGRRPPRRTR
jgi:hypothetical protein